jgi:hypothetical protein
VMSRLLSDSEAAGLHNPLGMKPAVSMSQAELRSMIAKRAYELYERRSDEFGDAFNDWLRAEDEIVSKLLEPTDESDESEPAKNRPDQPRTKPSKSARTRNAAKPRGKRQSRTP